MFEGAFPIHQSIGGRDWYRYRRFLQILEIAHHSPRGFRINPKPASLLVVVSGRNRIELILIDGGRIRDWEGLSSHLRAKFSQTHRHARGI